MCNIIYERNRKTATKFTKKHKEKHKQSSRFFRVLSDKLTGGEMKSGGIVGLILGIGLLAFGIYHLVIGAYLWAVIKLIIGAGLIMLKFTKSRYGNIIFGHMVIVAGCMLVTAGIYYVPMIAEQIKADNGQISLLYIFAMPLFWGFFAIFGGICAIYHGFCKCVRKDWKV